MDKYTILIILNTPFVIFGLIKAFEMYKRELVGRIGLLFRVLFWGFIFAGLVFAESLYNFLFSNNLTDTTPLSLADVMLVTGIMFSLFLCIRLYAKIDILERRFSELHEELSINNMPPVRQTLKEDSHDK